MNVNLVFKALADPTRRKILDRLCEKGSQTLNEICGPHPISRQGVMKHLAILEEANLISVEWMGREKLHTVNPVPIQETFGRWVDKLERHRLQALDQLKENLERKSQVTRRKKDD